MEYTWGNRPALTGVRALAVYLVVAFHSGLGNFAGGFVGVDLFFVLSGFLVCQVVLQEFSDTDRLSLRRFYARRTRRLLPAALTTIVVSSALTIGMLPTAVRGELVDDARAALLYFSNWHFISSSEDYFALDTAKNLFVHFWSLSIEEQFYFVFPLLMIALAKFIRARRLGVVLTIVVGLMSASVATQILMSSDGARAYYGTDTRVYQLLAGAALATLFRMRPRVAAWTTMARNVAFLAGVALLVTVAMNLFHEFSVTNQGFIATVASLLIICALDQPAPVGVTSLFRWRPFVFLGEISYGTYLWHWPLLIVLGQVFVMSPGHKFVLTVIMATGVAALSATFLELPIRESARINRYPLSSVVMGMVLATFIALVVIPPILERDGRSVVRVREIPVPSATTVSGDWSFQPSASFDLRQALKFPSESADALVTCKNDEPSKCVLVPGSGLKVMVLGDSHAFRFLPVMEEIARQNNFELSATTSGSCLWQQDLQYSRNFKDNRIGECNRVRADLYERVIPELNPDVLVVTHRTFDTEFRSRIMGAPEFTDWNRKGNAFADTTDQTITWLRERGIRVVIIEPIPDPAGFNAAECLSDLRRSSQISKCQFSVDDIATKSEEYYRQADAKDPAVVSVNLDSLVCPRLPVCDPVINDEVVWTDDNHVSQRYWTTITDKVFQRLRATQMFDAPTR